MKYLSLLILLFLTNECYAQKTTKNTHIIYEASTRGSQLIINISSNSIEHIDNGIVRKVDTPQTYWKELLSIVEEIKLDTMEGFEPPSEKRNFDGALHANLTITVNDKSYYSQTFDHENPPKELKDLTTKILSVLKN